MNDFNTAMFQNQPAEGSETLTDAQIADIAEQAGVPADVAAGIEDGPPSRRSATGSRRRRAS